MCSTIKVLLLTFIGLLFRPITCYPYVLEGSKLCKLLTNYYYEYEEFYPLSEITKSQETGYYARIRLSFITEYGDVHILLSETDAFIDNNRCYEFALGGWGNSQSEIRRKDYIHQVYNMAQSSFYTYTLPLDKKVNIELSVSTDGVVNVLDLDSQVEFNLTDELGGIPVKYIAFAGYAGHETMFAFNCSDLHSKPEEIESDERKQLSEDNVKFNEGFQFVPMSIYVLLPSFFHVIYNEITCKVRID